MDDLDQTPNGKAKAQSDGQAPQRRGRVRAGCLLLLIVCVGLPPLTSLEPDFLVNLIQPDIRPMPPPDLHLQSSCYRAQRPALWSGVTAILHGAESVALRRDADERSPIVARLQQHDRALVVSDYVCFKGRYWYEMRLSDGQTGWVPDGDKASEAWSWFAPTDTPTATAP